MEQQPLGKLPTSITPYIKLVLWCLLYAFIGILIMIVIYNDRLRNYLDSQWHEIRCKPHIMPLAGFSSHVEGEDRMEKFQTNFNYCMAKNINNGFVVLVRPFLAYINMINKIIIMVSERINTFRGAVTVLRMMFKAVVSNTIEKLMNTYAAVVYIQEKMKNMIKRQSAIVEIVKQFISGIPFIISSAIYGPVPRFVVWLWKYWAVLLAQIIICIICRKMIPIVSQVACAVCLVCFSPATTVGIGKYKKLIADCRLRSRLDDNTEVEGIIYYGRCEYSPESLTTNLTELYPLYRESVLYKPNITTIPNRSLYSQSHINVAWITGSHAIYDQERGDWVRMSEWSARRGIKPVRSNEPVISLITNDHTIPISHRDHIYECKDYEEVGVDEIHHELAYKRQCLLNGLHIEDADIRRYCMLAKHRGIQLYTGMTYETFCFWVNVYDPGYRFPAIPTFEYIRDFFYNYQPSSTVNRHRIGELRSQLCGFRVETHDHIQWYSYHHLILAENTLVFHKNRWMRVFEIDEAVRITTMNASITIEPSFIINVYTLDHTVPIADVLLTDSMEYSGASYFTDECRTLDEFNKL
jgi:hypothetical protein